MKRFAYIQNPLNSTLDFATPLLGGFIPRKAELIEHWAISVSFDHYSKYASEVEYGIVFIVIDINGKYDKNIGDSLMLCDDELYITLFGKAYIRGEDKIMRIEDTETFTHGIGQIGCPKRLKNIDIKEEWVSSALIKPMVSAVLHQQFTISNLGSETIREKMTLIKIEPKLTADTFYEKLKNYTENPSKNISNAIEDYENLSLIPYYSPLKLLGYISILERLLTDDSKTNMVSISQQFSNKLVLINNRLGEYKLDFGKWFNPSTSEKKILLKIYTLRSKIAHGSNIDFKDKEIKELKSKENVQQFINALVKRTIYFSISEPTLINDLKSC